ncbi:unnamed protein product [Rotaria sordida]|uniref:EGF-like domain-containing protein n=1 Tax=Rotaria sordida TaxID=392033 RepID=A0A819Z5Z5_9BILA|nr:unnamed protein product [Rotaria sordida]CAF4168664.1 unnamed protein product [Rotaria sordida]
MSSVNTLIVTILSLTVVVDGLSNCSKYNPCSQYGYCRTDSNGNMSCECKFWWAGTICDEQTTSGKQVIAFGCISAFVIALYYGLGLVRYIRNRKNKSKENQKKENIEYPKLLDVALKTARRAPRLSLFLTTVLIIIVATAGLLGKWKILQPIHDEIVNKYQTKQSLYYIPNSFCNSIIFDQFNVITFPVACLLIIMFITVTKRTSLMRDKCHGYGGLPIPVDFISGVDRKFAAVVFAICADELITIFLELVGGRASREGEGIILTYLLHLLQVFVMGFRYYPFLAAVYINSIFTLICATLYAWLDYSITIVKQGMCEPDFYSTYDQYRVKNSTTVDVMFLYYGTGPALIAIQLCTDIPRYLCLAYINVKLPLLLIDKIYFKFKGNVSLEKKLLLKLTLEQRILARVSRPNSVEMLYVQNLFRSTNQRSHTKNLFGRLIPKKIYEWRDDFLYSSRVLCVYSSIFLLLYFVAIQACVRVIPYLSLVQTFLQRVFDGVTGLIAAFSTNDNTEVNGNTSNFPVPSLVRPYIIALFLTLIIIIIQLLVFLVNIRRNLLQTYRGDDSEIPRRQRLHYISCSSGNIHFAGYFIGYLIWGFILIALLSTIISISIEAFITYGSVRIIEKILKYIIPVVLPILLKQYINILLAQYVFLQHYGEVLALNNRRILMIFIYFNFFLDAFLGFVSSIFRLIQSLIGGILYMCRLDYSPLGRKLETLDGGFSAYCGLIHTECTHRHPVMLVFVSHLYTQYIMRQWVNKKIFFTDLSIEKKYRIQIRPSSRYIRKWKLGAFLIRNPMLVFYRKAFLNQLHIEEVRALNDIDDDGEKNMKQRLSIYTRRMSAAQLSIASDNSIKDSKTERF